MDKFLNEFLEKLKTIFGEKLSSVFVYGSCAVEDCSREFSDVNLMVVISDLKADDLKMASKAANEFSKKAKSLPVFMDKEEWFNGENLIDGLDVDKIHLRLQCEQEVKNLLIRLRQTYLANCADKKALSEVIKKSSKSFFTIFRTILRLVDRSVPQSHAEVVKSYARIVNDSNKFDEEFFSKVLDFRKNPKVIKSDELGQSVEKLIDSTNYVLKYVDELHK